MQTKLIRFHESTFKLKVMLSRRLFSILLAVVVNCLSYLKLKWLWFVLFCFVFFFFGFHFPWVFRNVLKLRQFTNTPQRFSVFRSCLVPIMLKIYRVVIPWLSFGSGRIINLLSLIPIPETQKFQNPRYHSEK